MQKKAILVLEDGTGFEGISFGSSGEKLAEVIFNTSMTGYQEILTDPSYRGQMVVMTYPLIGNYGINESDVQSSKIHAEGFIVGFNSRIFSNHRAKNSLSSYLKENNVIGLTGVDTRAITRHLRTHGAMKGIISTENFDVNSLRAKVMKWPGLENRDLVKDVTISQERVYSGSGKWKFVVIDCGVKKGILDELKKRNCKVIQVPAGYSAEQILKLKPDAVLISNGPGDPAGLTYLIDTARSLVGKLPLFGICLGHQLLGLALGGKTYKLKFGHHGGNHPVKNMITGKVYITSQNHNYCVNQKTLSKDIELTHVNLYDNTEAGMRHKKLPVCSVQFHPEACPGPRESQVVFDEFLKITREYYAKR